MRGPNKIVRVSVVWDGVLTPTLMQSIAAKLASPPMQMMARQVRKGHIRTFGLDLGGVSVSCPAKTDELQVNL